MTMTAAEKAQHVVAAMERATPYDLVAHRLGGDASDRRYYRLTYGVFGENRHIVMMELADAGPFIKSEEVTLYHDQSGELPFLNIHRFLADVGMPVPKVVHFDAKLGVLLLEDLGDTLLLDVAQGPQRDRVERLYQRAIDHLVYLQIEGTKRVTRECLAARQTFSTEMLLWEFRHFVEYGVEARFGKLSDDARQELDGAFRVWAEHLAALPRVFVHRDYHSRNLMVQGDRLAIIDFQDALMGPATYDLASLLRDSYIDLGWPLVDRLVDHYLDQWVRRGGEPVDREKFLTDLWITALQRNLKAAGRFVFIERVKGKAGYEKDIPRTLSYLAGYQKRAPALAPLIERIAPLTPELSPRPAAAPRAKRR
jgi:aminoglycoside/choline kinase family phosphotransferase